MQQQTHSATQKEPTAAQISTARIYAQMGMTDEEYASVVAHLGRLPNYTEIGVFSVMWSEHCAYKHSKAVLRKFPTTGSHVLMGPGEGAGIVDIGDKQAVVFKIESHNHPSAIEPYQGAATGVGGIIRDIFSMGARPVALCNSLRFGNLSPTASRVNYVFEHVVAGIAGYGNCIGIPTVGGEIMFDPSYEGNPLVNAMCVGLIDHDRIQRGIAQGVGNPVYYVGPPTGRDGIHGATFASEELSEQSEAKRPAVQVGDPFMEKLVLEACLEVIDQGLVLGIQDMGAAGLTCSSAEMASKAGNGMALWLDRVPQRETGMTAYELMLSESQERMLFVTTPDRDEAVRAVFSRYGLPCVHVGVVTDTGRLTLLQHGEVVADMPVRALVDECPMQHPMKQKPDYLAHTETVNTALYPPVDNIPDMLYRLLKSPTIASKEWVYSQFDYMVRTATLVSPGSDAAVVRVPDTNKALAMTTDGNGRYVYLNPRMGGRIAVAEAARNIVCSGAKPLAITDNLNFGSPQKPDVFWQLDEAVEGMAEACRAFGTPVIGGNVSLYNENAKGAIYPTPVVGMVGLVEQLAHVTTQKFKQAGDVVFLLGETFAELGGSELQMLLYGKIEGQPPMLDVAVERRLQEALLQAIRAGLVQSAHDVSEGGWAVALAECSIGGDIGVRVQLPATTLRPDQYLFSESQSRVVVTASPQHAPTLQQHMEQAQVPIWQVGVVGGDRVHFLDADTQTILTETVADLATAWKGAIPWLMNR